MNETIVTIFCAFTRRWAVERWLENLEATIPYQKPENTNLVFIVDTDEPYIYNKLKKFAEDHSYRALDIRMNSDHHPNEVRVLQRRQRIAFVKNQSKVMVAKMDGDIVVGLEDDTVFGPRSIKKLVDYIVSDDKCGFVEGVQCGRWGIKMIGAWMVDNADDPITAYTLRYSEDKDYLTQIYAGGFYGYATRKDLYIYHEYYSASSQPFGPDVNYGLYVCRKNYKCMLDYSIVFGHNDHNVILYPTGKIDFVTFLKNSYGQWIRHEESV